jgi:cell division protein FtsW
MGLLILVGLVVLFAISPYQIHRINAEGGSLDQGHYMLKQLTYLGIGAGVFSLSTMLPIPLWRRLASPLLLGAIALCMLLALLGAFSIPPAMCFNGACRWFDFGITSFQPAEMLKFAIVLYMAVFLAARVRDGKLNDLHQTLIPVITVLGIAALFVIGLQKDMGTGITIFGAVLTMLFLAGLSMRWIVLGGAGLVVLGGLLIVISPHRIERVTTFLSGNNVADASSYHIDMAKLAIGSGGLFGKGLGNGVQAFGYLPEALNDSIFAVLGEIFGFLGLIVIIGLFVALLVRIVQTSERLQDPLDSAPP